MWSCNCVNMSLGCQSNVIILQEQGDHETSTWNLAAQFALIYYFFIIRARLVNAKPQISVFVFFHASSPLLVSRES